MSEPKPQESPIARRRVDEIVGIVVLVLSLALLLSLISFNPADAAWNVETQSRETANWIGVIGAHVADLALQAFGLVAYTLPLFFLYFGWIKLRGRPVRAVLPRCLGWMACCLSLAALLGLIFPETLVSQNIRLGGLVGLLVATGLSSFLNTLGAALVLFTALILTLIVTANISFVEQVEKFKQGVSTFIPRWKTPRITPERMVKVEEGFEEDEELDSIISLGLSKPQPTVPIIKEVAKVKPAIEKPPEAVIEREQRAKPRETTPAPEPPPPPVRVVEEPRPKPPVEVKTQPGAAAVDLPLRQDVAEMLSTATVKKAKPEEKSVVAGGKPEPILRTQFTLPPITLLKEPEHTPESTEKEKEDLMQKAQQLALRCKEFAVTGHVHQISPGPVVTTFEFKPDPGVKYSRITSLVDDLCLALEAESIRIDRIPGKSTVGIEVPNKQPEIIYLREIIESRKYQHSRSKLTVALGKTIDGSIYVADLAKMPHLLIAGATGAGKSMTLNTIIMSLLYKATPDEVRLILIDPKRLELGLYEGLPHLLTPIVMDPKRAANALKWAATQMEDRYRLLASVGVRNIDQFNREVQASTGRTLLSEEFGETELKPLPYLVIIIDELADLMMVASSDVETSITRLAQMARAVGIHLVLTTQRPSVDVITGLIKANFPCRIAFRVSSKVDSRTIIDMNGAEQLLGRGDMLFLPPGTARLVRVHGAYVDEKDINGVVGFIKAQATAEYDESILMSDKEKEEEAAGGGGLRDELYNEALKIVVQMGRASTSVLQRRLRIGYGRAASIIDAMERDRFVEPANGTRPRAVTPAAREFYGRLLEMEEEEE
ncbi:MAG: DNA translocase FtsK [Acidobacteria bacterium]|nr:DNA translocase FtsK [Acidobacteriota bacterium]